ncbi:type II toxin-antitoxin system VapC family toxin [Granulicella sp. L60]|uniref:type II toxin-antitoxin system VapC family toxin n=1 Tax=Granulicella sp. L60 TaxID=1641866 RepID=UPI00131D23A6|nr:PIN domain-containing protein [Granulicella sp. L60]
MILVDTSVWIDHLRKGEDRLQSLLKSNQVLSHAFVIGEVAMGSFKQRGLILDGLRNLPQATIAEDDEVLEFISRQTLFGTGIGYIDVHLLAAVRLTPGALLWTRDKRLKEIAEGLSLAAPES